jgi:hypothetical protein
VLACGVLAAPQSAAASPGIQYGIQDDAWLFGGPGTFNSRLRYLQRLGVDVVRVNVRWNDIALRRPARPTKHTDKAYRWDPADALLNGLHIHGITPIVTLVGTPRWANGGRDPSWAPKKPGDFANFAYAATERYPYVHNWLIWNEPNKNWSLKPTTAATYVKLLNAAYAAIKKVNPGDAVGGGVTAPRGGSGDVAPVDWIHGMRAAGARLDAYAHHPYPIKPKETPWTGGCGACPNLTMASLDRLTAEVRRAFGSKTRIWLTEYGYQTNPPDKLLGVSEALQSKYMSGAALRAYLAPQVDMLIYFLIRDERAISRWQSGLFTYRNQPKRSASTFPIPITQLSRKGAHVKLWGQIRPGKGKQQFRVRFKAGRDWRWLPGWRKTTGRGYFTLTLQLPKGANVNVVPRGFRGIQVRVD